MKTKIHKYTTAAVFLIGILLHGSSLIVGREMFLKYILTPEFDSVFSFIMAYAGMGGILLQKYYLKESFFTKVFYWFSVSYLCISIPIHVMVIFTWDTTYIQAFPMWYSWFIIPFQLLLFWFWMTLKIDQERIQTSYSNRKQITRNFK